MTAATASSGVKRRGSSSSGSGKANRSGSVMSAARTSR
jgi:hypothetical protein